MAFEELKAGETQMQSETIIPLFPLGLVLLPQVRLPLHIFEERYKLMIGECLSENKAFGIVFFNAAGIQTAGCTARILKVLKRYEDGRLDILTRGQDRFLIKEIYDQKAYLEARVTFFDDETQQDRETCRNLAEKGIKLLAQFSARLETQVDSGDVDETDFKSISFLIAGCEGFSPEEKQRFLEMTSTRGRLEKSMASLENIMERMRLTAEVQKIIGGNGHLKQFHAPG
jgi:Lon protease-like protein